MIVRNDDIAVVIARRVKFFAIDLFGEKKFAKRGDYRISYHYKGIAPIHKLVSQSDFFRYCATE